MPDRLATQHTHATAQRGGPQSVKKHGSPPDGVTPDGVTPDGVTPDGVTPDGVTPDVVTREVVKSVVGL